MPYTLDQAKKYIAEAVLGIAEDQPIMSRRIIFDAATISRPWGWVFFHTFQHNIDANNSLISPSWLSPLLFDQTSGLIWQFGSGGGSTEDLIYDFEMQWEAAGKFWCLWVDESVDRTTVILTLKKLLKTTTANAKSLVPELPMPLFYGAHRHLVWMQNELTAAGLSVSIRLQADEPKCERLEIPSLLLSYHAIDPPMHDA